MPRQSGAFWSRIQTVTIPTYCSSTPHRWANLVWTSVAQKVRNRLMPIAMLGREMEVLVRRTMMCSALKICRFGTVILAAFKMIASGSNAINFFRSETHHFRQRIRNGMNTMFIPPHKYSKFVTTLISKVILQIPRNHTKCLKIECIGPSNDQDRFEK